MSKEVTKEIEKAQQELDLYLKNAGLLDGPYNAVDFCRKAGHIINEMKKLYYVAAKTLWIVRKKESYKDFIAYAKKYASLGESQANFYAQTFEESLKMSLSVDQANELGLKKIHALYQIAPPEAVEEYKDKGTILDVSPAQISLKELEKMLEAYESNTSLQLEEETHRKNQLLEEIKELRKENADLRRYRNAQQTGVFDFKAEHVLNRVVVAIMEANRFLEVNRLENAVDQKLAQGKLDMIDMHLHTLRGQIVNLVFREAYDPENAEIQRIMNDDRFDFSAADDIITED